MYDVLKDYIKLLLNKHVHNEILHLSNWSNFLDD